MIKKISWYFSKIFFLTVVCIRLLIECIIHPKKIKVLLFSLFSTINEFYQFTHGKLKNFLETRTYKEIYKNLSFVKSNVFNADPKVTRPMESPVLATLVKHLNPDTIFEIGTYDGYTTLHFANNSHENCKVYTMDLPEDFNIHSKEQNSNFSFDDQLVVELSKANINRRMYKGRKEESKITEIFADSLTHDFSPLYGKIDLVFIDGNHSYKYVKSDTENALRMLSDNGVILWHDFDYIIHRDIFKYLNQLSVVLDVYSIPNTRFAIYGKKLQ